MIRTAYRLASEATLVAAKTLAAARLAPARWRLDERLKPPVVPAGHGDAPRGRLWLHAASLGECKGLWAFARVLRRLDPDVAIVLTVNTTAGLDHLRARILAEDATDRVIAAIAPLDHPGLTRRFLRTLDIRAVMLFEVELWPHRIEAARRAGIPVHWISARLTERARRRYAGNPIVAAAFRRVLAGIDVVRTQTDADAHALRRLGVRDVITGGDLRGLHALHARRAITVFGSDAEIPGARSGVAFVSFHADELDALETMIAAIDARGGSADEPIRVFPRASREIPRFRKRLESLGFRARTRDPGARRLIVDSFGLVDDTLRTARVAVIGGSFDARGRTGGHNLWEPLLAGPRIVIGPRHQHQAYLAGRLADAGLLRVAEDAHDAGAILAEALAADDDASLRDSITARTRETFIENERARLHASAEEIASKLLEQGFGRISG